MVLLLDTVGRLQTAMRIVRWFNPMLFSLHILSFIGAAFIFLGIVQYTLARDRAVQRLQLAHLSVERCSVSASLAITPGDSNRVAWAQFLNDPKASEPTQLANLMARVVYYDSEGVAYLNVDAGLWKPNSWIQYQTSIGDSESLEIALQDASGKAFTIGFTPQGPYDPYRQFRADLKEGPGEVHVILSHLVRQGERQNQEFRFRLTTGSEFRIEQISGP